jgi:hypothetical protein
MVFEDFVEHRPTLGDIGVLREELIAESRHPANVECPTGANAVLPPAKRYIRRQKLTAIRKNAFHQSFGWQGGHLDPSKLQQTIDINSINRRAQAEVEADKARRPSADVKYIDRSSQCPSCDAQRPLGASKRLQWHQLRPEYRRTWAALYNISLVILDTSSTSQNIR